MWLIEHQTRPLECNHFKTTLNARSVCLSCSVSLCTFIKGRESIECGVVLFQRLAEVVGSQAVLPQRTVDAAQVVEEVGAEALTSVWGNWVLGGGAQHFEGLAVVLSEVLHVSLQVLGTSCLQCTEECASKQTVIGNSVSVREVFSFQRCYVQVSIPKVEYETLLW